MVTDAGPHAARARADGVAVCLLDRGYPSTSPAGPRGADRRQDAELRGEHGCLALRAGPRLRRRGLHVGRRAGAGGPRSTVVAVTGRVLRTPPVEAGILPGTTVAAIFALAHEEGWRARRSPLVPDDLLAADSVWLCSSVTVAARVTRIDDVPMPLREAGADTAAQFADLAMRAVVRA